MSQRLKVIVTEWLPYYEEAERILSKVAEVKIAKSTLEEDLAKEVADADALIVGAAKITRKVIEAAKKLKVISRIGVGLENIDIKAATEKGILVVHNPGINAKSVAEYTILLILALARHLVEACQSLKSGKWEKPKFLGMELCGKTLGIIGLGSIGREVAKFARGFGMEVLAYDPYVSNEKAAEIGAKLVELDRLLSESDFVTIHSPLTDQTRGLINEEKLKLMKKSAFLINTARGPIVDSKALFKALKDGIISGAAIDVFDKEPPEPNDPLIKLDNVIVTPHIAALTKEAYSRMWMMAAQKTLQILLYNNEKSEGIVN